MTTNVVQFLRADGTPVTVEEGQPLPVGIVWAESMTPPTEAVVSAVAASAQAVELAPVRPAREGMSVYNELGGAVLYLKLGDDASVDSYSVLLSPGDLWEPAPPAYTGVVSGVWASASGRAMVTELLP